MLLPCLRTVNGSMFPIEESSDALARPCSPSGPCPPFCYTPWALWCDWCGAALPASPLHAPHPCHPHCSFSLLSVQGLVSSADPAAAGAPLRSFLLTPCIISSPSVAPSAPAYDVRKSSIFILFPSHCFFLPNGKRTKSWSEQNGRRRQKERRMEIHCVCAPVPQDKCTHHALHDS